MKYFILIPILVLVVGCCPKVTPQISNALDSVRVEYKTEYIEKLRDTTIYVNVPAESKETDGKRDSSFLETSVARSLARINPDGSLFHNLENKPSQIPATVSVKDTELLQRRDSIVYRDKYVVDIVVEKHIPKSYWWLLGISILSICVFVYNLYRRYTNVKKIHLPRQ